MRRIWIAAVTAIVCLSFLGSTRNANAQLVNGDFEAGAYVFDGNGADSLVALSTAITGWTTVNAELAVITQPNTFSILAESGTKHLDLTGYHDSGPYAGITQTVNTVAGRNYSLSFYIGSQTGNVSIDVTTGLTTATYTNSSGGAGPVWQQFTHNFTATGATFIQFLGTATSSGNYIGLDNITLAGDFTPARSTPEPGSLALLVGIAVAAQGVRRKNRHCAR